MTASVAARQFVAAEQLTGAELRRRLTGRRAPRRVLNEVEELVGQIFEMVRTGVGDLAAQPQTDEQVLIIAPCRAPGVT